MTDYRPRVRTLTTLFWRLLALLGVGMLYSFIYRGLIPVGSEISLKQGDTRLHFAADRSFVVWPLTCVRLQWDAEHISQIFLDHQPVVGTGDRVYCIEDTLPTFRVVFPDKSVRHYELAFTVIDRSVVPALLGVLIAAFLISLKVSKGRAMPAAMRQLDRRLAALGNYPIIGLCVGIVLIAFAARAVIAFSTTSLLNWDEAYYASIAVTGARREGLFPYVFGYGQMPVMGGIGYVAYLYVFAVQIFGNTIFALRGVSVAASLLALIPIFLLARLWYGSVTAWVSVALTSSMYLFRLTNTVRMDSMTIAFESWALLAVAYAMKKGSDLRWHFLAGALFGIGLEVHIDTSALAFACGLLYLVDYVREARESRQWLRLRSPLSLFVMGYALGLTAYLTFNLWLPGVDYFFRTAGTSRVLTTPQSAYCVSRDILSTIVPSTCTIIKEISRYTQFFNAAPAEALLTLAAIGAALRRGEARDKRALILLLGGMVGGALVFQNSALVYFSHLTPLLILPLAPLLTPYVSRRPLQYTLALSSKFLLALLIVLAAFSVENVASLSSALGSRAANQPEQAPPIVLRVKALAKPDDVIVGPRAYFVPFFMDYHYISSGWVERLTGMSYYRITDSVEYWTIKQPDIIFGDVDSLNGLSDYVVKAGYIQVEPSIWVKPGH